MASTSQRVTPLAIKSTDRSGFQSSRPHTYDRTRLLCIFFAADQNFRAELERVKATFFHQRICSLQGIEVWGIPVGTGDASNIVRNKLMEFKRDRDGVNELLIVMYGGHARVEVSQRSQSQRTLVWGSSATRQIVYWSSVQEKVLLPGNKDTLLILDCCHAGAAQREVFTACKDIIAACAWDKGTPEMGAAASFTSFLLRALVQFRIPFTVRTLMDSINALGPSTIPVHQELPRNCEHLITLTPFGDFTQAHVSSQQVRMQAHDVTVSSPSGRTQIRDVTAKGIDIDIEIGWGPYRFKFRISFLSRSLSGTGAASSSLQVDNYLERTDQSPSNFPPGFSLRDSTFFRQGRVFKILWATESSSSPGYEERAMIVVTSGSDIAYASPYNGGQQGGAYGQAQTSRQSGTPIQQVDPASIQNDGKIYGVKFNVPVRKGESLSDKDLGTFMGAFRSKYESRHRRDGGTVNPAPTVVQPATSNAYQQRSSSRDTPYMQSANPSRQPTASYSYQTRQASNQAYTPERSQPRAMQPGGQGRYQPGRLATNSLGRYSETINREDEEQDDEDESDDDDDDDDEEDEDEAADLENERFNALRRPNALGQSNALRSYRN